MASTTLFYLILGLAFLFSVVVRNRLKSTYARWSRVPSRTGNTGGQVARFILDRNQLPQVSVEPVRGTLTDHYDPRSERVRLSEPVFAGSSVAAVAISAHESGHALQDAADYLPLEFRTRFAPIASAGARFGVPLAIYGGMAGSTLLVLCGMIGYATSIVFHIVTLPIEFNASRRALAQIETLHLVTDEEHDGAEQVLRAAAMTYVAGVASSAGYVIYLLLLGGQALSRRRTPLPPN